MPVLQVATAEILGVAGGRGKGKLMVSGMAPPLLGLDSLIPRWGRSFI